MDKLGKLLGVMAIVFFVAIAYGKDVNTKDVSKDKAAKDVEIENMFNFSGFEMDGIRFDKYDDGGNLSYWIKSSDGHHGAIRSANPEDKYTVTIDDKADFLEGNNSLKVDIKTLTRILLISLHGVDEKKIVSGEEYTVEIWAKANRDGAKAVLFFEGRASGEHFWKASDIVVNKKWKKYTFTQVMPEKIEGMWLRLDIKSEAIFWIDGNKFYKEP